VVINARRHRDECGDMGHSSLVTSLLCIFFFVANSEEEIDLVVGLSWGRVVIDWTRVRCAVGAKLPRDESEEEDEDDEDEAIARALRRCFG
jgi:hypothetical protein